MAENKGKGNMNFKISVSVMAIYFALGWGDVWAVAKYYDTTTPCSYDGDCTEEEHCTYSDEKCQPYGTQFWSADDLGCCTKTLSSCPSGTDWSSWSNYAGGTQVMRTRTRVETTSNGCNVFYEADYECAAGFYRRTDDEAIEYYGDVLVCERCPSIGGVYGTSTPGNNNMPNSCYIPANTVMTQGSNQFYFGANCPFTCTYSDCSDILQPLMGSN
jgi:hypothetical protein